MTPATRTDTASHPLAAPWRVWALMAAQMLWHVLALRRSGGRGAGEQAALLEVFCHGAAMMLRDEIDAAERCGAAPEDLRELRLLAGALVVLALYAAYHRHAIRALGRRGLIPARCAPCPLAPRDGPARTPAYLDSS